MVSISKIIIYYNIIIYYYFEVKNRVCVCLCFFSRLYVRCHSEPPVGGGIYHVLKNDGFMIH